MSSPEAEYLRRAAEAAERTRRNSTILVWALVGVPCIVALVATLVYGIDRAASSAAVATQHTAIEQVEAVYRQVGYTPPAYTDVRSQTRGICENLAKGMSQDEAAVAMVQGFGEGMLVSQAKPIVAAAASAC